jgi:hypothetical protein
MLWTSLLAAAVLAVAGDGDPEARALVLAVSSPSETGFDLKVQWPSLVKKPGEPKCTTTLTLPDGTKPALDSKVTSSGPDFFIAHLTAALKAEPAVWSLSVSCPGLDSGAQPFGVFGTPTNAFMIIPFGAKTREEAETWLSQHQDAHAVPTRGLWPRVLESQWVLGMTPGFFVVGLGAADDKSVADTLAKELNRHDITGTYVKQVWWPQPEPLRLLVVDAVVDSNKVLSTTDWNEIYVMQEGVPHDGSSAHVRSAVWFDGKAVLLFSCVPTGANTFGLYVSAPQTDCKEKQPSLSVEDDKKVQHLKRFFVSCVQGD